MSTGPLKSLSIAHLRGCVRPFTLFFEKGKKLTVVYGENATGKSTICDAFELLGSGNVGSLDGRGLGATDRYRASVGMAASDVVVTLTADQACRARIVKNEVTIMPPGSRPRVSVLRRKKITVLVEGKPADRYAAIRGFVDVDDVETSENALRELIRDLEKSRVDAAARVQENHDTLLSHWASAGRPGADEGAWAESELARDQTASTREVAAINAMQGALAVLSTAVRDAATSATRSKQAEEAYQARRAAADLVVSQAISQADDVVALLQAARTLLAGRAAVEECPLCEVRDGAPQLAERVAARLDALSAVRGALAAVDSSETTRGRAAAEATAREAAVYAAWSSFDKCRAEHVWPQDVPVPLDALPADDAARAIWLSAAASLYPRWDEARATRSARASMLGILKHAFSTWRTNLTAQQDLDVLVPRLELALQIAVDARREFTDEVLAEIAAEVGRLYESVHPGEGLNKISLMLDPKKRGSLEIGASFLGNPHPPQAYFSDSHLDTLGLCIFIALASMDEPENLILVLDDVLASVDEPHVQRLIEMLYVEVLRFRHCAITTHYKPWKHKFRWGWLTVGECQFVELAKWSGVDGVSQINTVPEVERLRTLLTDSDPDLQLVCAKAGVILEAALEFLTVHYECHVPRRAGGRYTLGDLLPAVDKKLRKALQIEVAKAAIPGSVGAATRTVMLGPFLDELTRIAQVRNVVGCHFNDLSADLLDADAALFGKTVLELADVLIDVEAGWPRNGKSGQYWATAGESRKLHPYKRPM